MKDSNPVLRYLEKLSEEMEADIEEAVSKFFGRLTENLFRQRDVYCFRPKAAALFNIWKVPGDYLNAVCPMENTDFAVWISISRSETASDGEKLLGVKNLSYSVEATFFNLTASAGNPVDLQILRGEKMIIDTVAVETLKSILQKGILKERKKLFSEKYCQKIYPPLLKKLLSLFHKPPKVKTEEIVRFIQNAEAAIQWFIDNPDLNRFRSRTAINY